MRLLIFSIAVSLIINCSGHDKYPELATQQQQKEHFIDSLLNQMTLAEKIGQMSQSSGNWQMTGPAIADSNTAELVRSGRLGSFLNVFGVAKTRKVQELAVNESRLGIPLIFGYDMIHGYATTFPIPLAEAASWDLELIRRSAEITALEGSASGVHWNFAPMVDIARDPRWGRIMEGAGEDPWWGAQVAVARVRGYQGQDLSSTATIAATAKHFAAYGAAEGGRDYNSTEVSERTLRDVYLRPFQAAAGAGVAAFMNGFNDLNGIPATANQLLVRQILKKEWAFKGLVVSDWASVQEMTDHGIAANDREAAGLALEAGCDMEMVSKTYAEHLEDLVAENPAYLPMIDEAVRRILGVKYDLGLFQDPFRYCDEKRESEYVRQNSHFKHAREIAKRSIVLLENRNNTLPLRLDIPRIAIIGPLANDHATPLGTWSAQGRPEDVTTVLEGVQLAVSQQTRILTTSGCEVSSQDRSGFREAVSLAKQADVVIAVVGESDMMSGEALSRADIDLPGVQLELLQLLKATGKPIIVVLMNGRPIAEPWMYEHCDAVLEVWHLGVQSGPAIADVLFGKYNPAGKLPVTIPRGVGQIPIYYNHKITGRPADPQDRYTSKYIDLPWTPQYPFGYGLSYSEFAYSDLQLDHSTLTPDGSLQVSVTITNTSKRAGEEVVQLYIRDLFGSVTRPVLELKDFRKLMLEAGESRQIHFQLTPDQLRFWDRELQFRAEPGAFKVLVGPHSGELLEASFTLLEAG